MIVLLEKDLTNKQQDAIQSTLSDAGYKTSLVSTQYKDYIISIGKPTIDIRAIGRLSGVEDVYQVDDSYQLVSKQWKIGSTGVDLGDDIYIQNGHFHIMAGPCSIESEEQIQSTVKHLRENNIRIMRGGVFKPRSSPYSFRGLGLEGLKIFSAICKENGIRIVTEVMKVGQIEEMIDYIDIFQVGARNSQNFNLLDALGEVDKPVLLKRGISGTIEELLNSAEYIFSNGNERIMLCERGIRSYEKAYRNCMDINAISILKEKTHLPVIADPSHGIGIRSHVENIALAATIAGADGVIVEVHETPEKAASDGQQTLNYREASKLYGKLRKTFEMRQQLRY